jgi:hypothetical protein
MNPRQPNKITAAHDISKKIPTSLSPEKIMKMEEERGEIEQSNHDSEDFPVILKGLEDLIFLGRVEKVINIGSFTFKISSLTNQEQDEVNIFLMSLSDEQRVLQLKRVIIAQCLRSINNIAFEKTLNIQSPTMDDKCSFLAKLQSSVVDQIFDGYTKLITESKEIISSENIKK